MLPLKQYFKPSEFACKCGCGAGGMDSAFMDKLNQARRAAGIPFIVTSGLRCKKHNKDVGGVGDSAHLTGHAADIRAVDLTARFKIVQALLDAGLDRIGVGLTLIHVDDDPTKDAPTMWVYQGK